MCTMTTRFTMFPLILLYVYLNIIKLIEGQVISTGVCTLKNEYWNHQFQLGNWQIVGKCNGCGWGNVKMTILLSNPSFAPKNNDRPYYKRGRTFFIVISKATVTGKFDDIEKVGGNFEDFLIMILEGNECGVIYKYVTTGEQCSLHFWVIVGHTSSDLITGCKNKIQQYLNLQPSDFQDMN